MRPRTKAKKSEKPSPAIRTAVARLVKPSPPDFDDIVDLPQRVGVQSLGRAFAILEEVARHREGIGLADLSKRVGLHNSTTFHLAKTMVSLGYIRQEKDSKRYRVGRPLFALAASALDEIEMVNLATPVLEDLSRATGESSHFSVRMGDTVVVIARTGGPGAFQLADRVGVVRPAHCTALGKAILASLQPNQLEHFLKRVKLKPSTEKSITEIPVLLREIEEIRRTGVAFDDGEFNLESAAWRPPSKTSPAKPSARSAFPARSGDCPTRYCNGRPRSCRPRLLACRPNSAPGNSRRCARRRNMDLD